MRRRSTNMKLFIQKYGAGIIYKTKQGYVLEVNGKSFDGQTIDQAVKSLKKNLKPKKKLKD